MVCFDVAGVITSCCWRGDALPHPDHRLLLLLFLFGSFRQLQHETKPALKTKSPGFLFWFFFFFPPDSLLSQFLGRSAEHCGGWQGDGRSSEGQPGIRGAQLEAGISLVPLSEVNQGSGVQFTTRKAFRALCQKDQVWFIFNFCTFSKLPPHWLLDVKRRRYGKLCALVQALEHSPAVLCSLQPADWNDALDWQAGRRCSLLFFSWTALISQTPSACGWLIRSSSQEAIFFFPLWDADSYHGLCLLPPDLEIRLVEDKT